MKPTETARQPMMPRMGLLVFLVFVSMLAPFSLNVLMPSLPGLAAVFAASRDNVQLSISLFIVGMAVSQLVSGTLADRFGRRPVMIAATGLYVVASFGAIFATSIWGLVLARIFQALGGTVGVTLSRTMVRDLYGREAAASMIGYVTMGMVVAPMFAPGLGGVLDEGFGWRAVFLACGVLGAATLLATIIILPETRPQAAAGGEAGDALRRSRALLKRPQFLSYAAVAALASAIFFTLIGAAPFLVIEVLGLSKPVFGIWFMTAAGGYMLGNFASGRLSQRIGIDRMIMTGNIMGFAGTGAGVVAALILPAYPATLFVPAFVMALGNGLVLPNAIAGAVSVDPRAAGGASGLLGFAQMGIGAGATFIGGSFLAGSILATMGGMFLWATLSLAACLIPVRRPAG